MEESYINVLKGLDYANLTSDQEKRLHELEKQFNSEFGKDFYFMVMNK